MFNRILIPLDGSALAERAIPHAEQFARIFKSNITLLQILDSTSNHEHLNPIDPLKWQIRKAEAELYMNGIATRLRENLRSNGLFTPVQGERTDTAEKEIRVDYALREGKTAENIVNFAHSENIDLVVISTHGSGGFSRWNISSITAKVVNQIYLPVLIIRAYHQPHPEVERIHYRRILLPIDSSRRAECALPAAIELARGKFFRESVPETSAQGSQPDSRPGTKLLLAAVIKPPELPIPEPHPAEITQLSEQLLHISRYAVNNYLNELKERLPADCETCVLENSSVSSAIHDLADREEDIDLVILCAHGHTGQSTWPYGSVARNYIEHGNKPVLIIQDVLRSQVRPTAAEIACEKSGRR